MRRWTRACPTSGLRSVEATVDLPPLSEALRRLIERIARETLAPPGSVLRLALSVPAAMEPGPTRSAFRLPDRQPEEPLDDKRQRVIDALSGSRGLPAAALARKAGVSTALVKRMAESGQIEPVVLDADDVEIDSPRTLDANALTSSQRAAADRLIADLRNEPLSDHPTGFRLLEGVPGSGKTEVYHELIQACLDAGRRALVLLPEIALSAQWIERFEARFGVRPVTWHSGLTAAQRRKTYKAVARGQVRVLVGARSALFLPFPDLGLVIMDEAHDPSFKQGDGVIYDARSAAETRCRLENALLVLVSATPSLESVVAVDADHHLRLMERYASVPRPTIGLVDLRNEKPPSGVFIGQALRGGLSETLETGEQALLFLNRRGYAPLTVCRACGFRFHCPSCTAWLIAHRYRPRLQCHHCGYSRPPPEHCPECGTVDYIAASGPGVERIAEEVKSFLPDARLAIMTSDTVHNAADAERLVNAMLAHEIDILIGTQLVAKGHHFPDLTFAGVIDADIGLGGGDLRAAERTFQLLYQLAGRAGRADRPGRVLVQTREPDHPVMQALARGDRDRFVEAELAERREAGMPPFGRLASLILSGADSQLVRKEGRRLAAVAPEAEGVLVLGPAPAPLAMLRGRYRERFLVKADPTIDLPAFLRRWLAAIRLARPVRLQIDIDPQSFL